MCNDNNMIGKELVSQTAGKAYDDIAHPAAQATGQILSFIPRTVRLWFRKWENWIINGEHTIQKTQLLLNEKLKDIPKENIVEPEAYVAIPAIQQLSYSFDSEELRELYANLLASSMNVDTKHDVHPAFVDIIKQLNPDEAKLLKYLSKQNGIPAIEVQLQSKKDNGYFVLEDIRIQVPEDLLYAPQNTQMYIENLIRLKLLDVPAGIHYKSDSLYEPIERSVKYDNFPQEMIKFKRKVLEFTSFGKQFNKICQQ